MRLLQNDYFKQRAGAKTSCKFNKSHQRKCWYSCAGIGDIGEKEVLQWIIEH